MRISFLCVGFSKCGTTSIYDALKQHPDIFLPTIKEIPFFTRPEFYTMGLSWYKKRFFSSCKKNETAGEINPLYTTKNIARKLSKHFDENTKIIFIMRNPVDRMYSHFRMDMRYGYKLIPEYMADMDINTQFNYYVRHNCISKNKIRRNEFMLSGNYYQSICEYMKYFKRKNMLFLFFEDYIKAPEKTIQEIMDFLCVKKLKIDVSKISNEGNIIPRNKFCMEIRDTLYGIRRKCIKYFPERYDNLMNKIFDYLLYHVTMKPDKEKHIMDIETRKYLEEFYREDKNNLESLLKIDMSEKWYK